MNTMLAACGLAPSGRRAFLKQAAATAVAMALPVSVTGAFAANPSGRKLHGLSAFGRLKYPADFRHFDYVDPEAPQGGRMHFSVPSWMFNQSAQTFNTLNTFILKGDAPPRMETCFDTLMVAALDEPDAIYCHTAEWVEISQDRNVFRFSVRPEARFHDGTPLSAEDVAFSLMLLKREGHPLLAQPLRDLESATVSGSHLVELTYNGRQSSRAILAAAVAPILSRTFYTANSFDSSSMDVPLSSGARRVADFEAGRFIEYQRVDDYWGADLPTARGLGNFDILRIEFFAERQAAFEAFKKGDIHFREEFTSKTWATEYDFPAIDEARVIKAEFPSDKLGNLQGWALNQRRERFADWRVRQAINLCFDFEWTNDKIFYGAYARAHSPFENSDFKAEGLPDAAELALLEPYRDLLPPAVFGEAVLQPVSDGSGRDRRLLAEANRLLLDAGYERQGTRLVRNGTALSLEMLISSSVFERLAASHIENLRRIGIDASIRLVDPAQYNARLAEFDYDMIMARFSIAPTPTAEALDNMFSSSAAGRPGSRNYPGLKDPAVDALIERIRAVDSREDLVVIMRAMDRILRARLDWIPNWYGPNRRVAYWDMFGFVDPKPDYGWPVEQLWWFDENKARSVGRA